MFIFLEEKRIKLRHNQNILQHTIMIKKNLVFERFFSWVSSRYIIGLKETSKPSMECLHQSATRLNSPRDYNMGIAEYTATAFSNLSEKNKKKALVHVQRNQRPKRAENGEKRERGGQAERGYADERKNPRRLRKRD